MVTFNDLLSWNGEYLRTAGDSLNSASHKYEHVHYGLNDLSSDGLSGQTAEAEGKARRILADDAEDLWTALNRAGNDLIDSATTVNYIYRNACSLDSRIKGDEMSIDGNNQVTINPNAPSDSSSIDNQVNYQIELDDLMVQAAETITFIKSIYDTLANVDDIASGPKPEVVNAGTGHPNPSWTPNDVNDWWTSLSISEREKIIQEHPGWVGNLDGIPMNDRDRANRVWLPIMQAEIDQKVKNFEPKTIGTDEYGNPLYTPEYAALLQRQNDIHSLSAMFSDPEKSAGRTLLVLDNTGDHFRAAIGSGDVDNADHVAVYTPGMATTVNGGLARMSDDPEKDGAPGSAVNSTERILTESGLPWNPNDKRFENVDDYQRRSMETVAGVTWLGYDAPGWYETLTFSEGTVLTDSEAKKAAPDLAKFYEGVQATHHGDPHMVAYGHSYGSTATGEALKLSTAPDDVSVMGSPGPGAINAEDLHMLPDHMYATAAPGDRVAASAGMLGYGGDPVYDPSSDFASLDTDERGAMKSSSGHSEYVNDGTTSLDNQGRILRDQRPRYYDGGSSSAGTRFVRGS
jgi:hypothetical protein